MNLKTFNILFVVGALLAALGAPLAWAADAEDDPSGSDTTPTTTPSPTPTAGGQSSDFQAGIAVVGPLNLYENKTPAYKFIQRCSNVQRTFLLPHTIGSFHQYQRSEFGGGYPATGKFIDPNEAVCATTFASIGPNDGVFIVVCPHGISAEDNSTVGVGGVSTTRNQGACKLYWYPGGANAFADFRRKVGQH